MILNSEVKTMSVTDLEKKLMELKKEIRKNEFVKVSGGLKQTHVLRRDRSDVARVLTELKARDLSKLDGLVIEAEAEQIKEQPSQIVVPKKKTRKVKK